MARSEYGKSMADYGIDFISGRPAVNAVYDVWTAETGGAQVLDLLNSNSNPVTIVTADDFGFIAFWGPDGFTGDLWLEGADGTPRLIVRPVGLTGRVSAVEAALPPISGGASLVVTDGTGKIADSLLPPTMARASTVGTNLMNPAYGAVANGTADDTAAFTAAKTAAGVDGAVVVPAGTYRMQGFFFDVAGQTWTFQPGAKVLFYATGATFGTTMWRLTAPVTILGGDFDNARSITGGASNSSSYGCLIQNVVVPNATKGATIRGAVFRNMPYGFNLGGSNSPGVTLDRCYSYNSSMAGIWFQNSSGAAMEGPQILNCVVDNSMSASIYTSGITMYASTTSQRWVGGRIANCRVTVPTSGLDVNTGCIGVVNGSDFEVSGCRTIGSEIAISVPNAVNGKVLNNTVRDYHGIGIEWAGPIVNGICTGNAVINTVSANNVAVSIGNGAVDGLLLANNVFSGGLFSGGQDVLVTNNGACKGLVFAGNTFRNDNVVTNRTGITFNGSADYGPVTIGGNTFLGNGATGCKGAQFNRAIVGLSATGNTGYGLAGGLVVCAGSSGTWDYLTFLGNTMLPAGAVTSGAELVGTFTSTAAFGTNNRLNSNEIVDTFTANGTWTNRAGARTVVVEMLAGGSGAGSGRRGAAATIRCGGGGGGGAGFTRGEFAASALTATVAVTVGAAGVGGAVVTTDDTNGNAGTAGGGSFFGSYLRALAGGGGGGGTNAAGTAGGAGDGGFIGTAGAAASATGGVGAAPGSPKMGAAGGAAGGGITSADVPGAGAAGAPNFASSYANPAGGTVPGGAGTNGGSVPAGSAMAGASAGSGAASITGAAGAGGNGGSYGSGGAGGGASLNTNASGKGGAGAPGIVRVTTRF